jgi:hypothetical protein
VPKCLKSSVQARLDEAMAKANLAADNAMMLEHKVSNLELELSEVRCASAREMNQAYLKQIEEIHERGRADALLLLSSCASGMQDHGRD